MKNQESKRIKKTSMMNNKTRAKAKEQADVCAEKRIPFKREDADE